MANGTLIREAAISDEVVRYQVLSLAVTLGATIIGVPLLLIAVPIAQWYWTRYYQNLRVVLTTRELKVHRGILVREEKSIPLEKITDLAVYEGPVMRWMKLKGIRVETAGQSSGQSALVSVVGLEDTDGFRDRVLAQRDRITDREDGPRLVEGSADAVSGGSSLGSESPDAALLETLTEIRDSLGRIEGLLGRNAHGV